MESPRGMVKTAERTVCCQELVLADISFLDQVAVARPLNAPARINEGRMEDGELDEILSFFTDEVPDYESAAPRLRVKIGRTAAWPESLPKERAVNERGQQLAERLYVFQHLHNSHSGERLKVEVRGSFGNDGHDCCCCEEREDCLRVAEMVLHFRPDCDYDDKKGEQGERRRKRSRQAAHDEEEPDRHRHKKMKFRLGEGL